jgi:hypothetical protein
MDVSPLKIEIASDPLGRRYVSMDDKQLLASLLEVNRTLFTVGGLRTELDVIASFPDTSTGIAVLEKMEAIAADNKLLARLLPWMKAGASGLDVSLQVVRDLINSLVPDPLPQEFADAILNLGKRPCSRAEEIGMATDADSLRQAIYIVRHQK